LGEAAWPTRIAAATRTASASVRPAPSDAVDPARGSAESTEKELEVAAAVDGWLLLGITVMVGV
jgi:hypothetical protein